jgi:hypothetical protein
MARRKSASGKDAFALVEGWKFLHNGVNVLPSAFLGAIGGAGNSHEFGFGPPYGV